jgi:hypothetical protein
VIKSRIQLRNVQNVAASKTALIDCPIGRRYHYIQLQHGYAAGTNTITATASNILEIRIKVNGRVQRTVSGTQLRDLNILQGLSMGSYVNSVSSNYDFVGLPNTAPGVSIPLFFAEPWLFDEASQDALAWATNSWSSFQIEVDLGAASTPTLQAWAIVDDLQPQTPGGIVKWIRQSFPASGTQFDISTIDRRDYLREVNIYPDSGGSNQPSQVTLRKDGVVLHELVYTANLALLTHYCMSPLATGRTANIYDLVLDHDGLLASAINMLGTRDITLTINSASAMSGTTVAIVQRLGPPE